jgi:hypothetical protein
LDSPFILVKTSVVFVSFWYYNVTRSKLKFSCLAKMHFVHFRQIFQAVETTKVQPVLFCCYATAITSFCPRRK